MHSDNSDNSDTAGDVIDFTQFKDSKGGKAGSAGRPSHAQRLFAALGDVALYRDKTSDHPYCDMVENGRRCTYAVDASTFKDAVTRLSCTLNNGMAMPPKSIQQVIDTCKAKAAVTPARDVFLRFARRGREVWMDLGDDTWDCVHITSQGWSIVPYADAPVNFWRPSGLLPLPRPEKVPAENAVEVLKIIVGSLFNLSDPHILLFAVTRSSIMCRVRPNVITNYWGRPGSAKTTAMRLGRMAIDPVRTLHINTPGSVEDFMIYARSNATPGIDNASALSPEMMDAVCGAVTGQGHVDRAHYTNNDATDFMVSVPIDFASVAPVTTRGDASSRAIDLLVPRITSDDRKLLDEIERAFNTHHPALLGALLEVAVAGLNPQPRPTQLPRSADFFYWGLGAGKVLAPLGDFATVFHAHKEQQARQAIESNPVLLAVEEVFALDGSAYAGVTSATAVLIVHDDGRATISSVPQGQAQGQPQGQPRTVRLPKYFTLKGALDFDASGKVTRWVGRMNELHHDLAAVKYGQETVKQAGWPMTAQYLGTALEHAGEQLETALGLAVNRQHGLGRQNRPVVEIVCV